MLILRMLLLMVRIIGLNIALLHDKFIFTLSFYLIRFIMLPRQTGLILNVRSLSFGFFLFHFAFLEKLLLHFIKPV